MESSCQEVSFYLNQQENPVLHLPTFFQHRLSIIKEVSDDSSTASTPRTSPKHQPLCQNNGGNHSRNGATWQEKLENNQYSDYINSNIGLKSENASLTSHQEIVIHTSGRGDGSTNLSSQR